jgi:hypothetical protein
MNSWPFSANAGPQTSPAAGTSDALLITAPKGNVASMPIAEPVRW